MSASEISLRTVAEPATSGPTFVPVDQSIRPDGDFDRALLHALQSMRRGDFSIRLAGDQEGTSGRIADIFNDIVAANEGMAQQLEFVGQHVGREGQARHRVKFALSGGAWGAMESTVNTLIADLLWPTMAVTDAIAAVARGNLLQTVRLDVDGRPLQGEFFRAATIVNTMIKQLGVFTSEVTRVAREVGTGGKLGGQAQVPEVTGVWKDLTESVNSMASNLTAQVRNIAEVTIAVANGDLSKKITVDVRGEILQLKEAINTMVDQLRSFASEVTRVAREVGTEGKLGGQAIVPGVAGTWKDLTDSVNAMCGSLTDQVRNIAQVTTEVARGDLSRKITVDVRGEILELKNTINTMVDQLNAFASEVTRVAREVGTEGRLGGEARVEGVAGIWKDLTDSVNDMARNLTAQVRNIAEVATAVARGDLSKKVTVDVRGEIQQLKATINTMVDQLNRFAGEVTRVAHEVGTEGRLGGQAQVPGVAGTWKDLTGNVNQLAANLTTQVRAIAEVATAVTKGDLTRSVLVDARGEVAELKDDINTMIANLRLTTERNTEQAWLKTNLAHFVNMLQGQRNLAAIGRMLLSELAPLVGAQNGSIYFVEDESGLRLLAGYADTCEASGNPDHLRIGEGLIGQCAADAHRFLITDVPQGVWISSGLFRAVPKNLIVLPISFEGRVKAVIELASLGSFTPLHVSLLEQLTASIGIVLNSIEATMKTEDLLKQTQMLAAELQAQQHELQQRVTERTAELAEANAGLERRVEERTREREAALAQVHEMQKLESLGQLTGGVAHDFNNLLATIIGNLEMIAAVLPKRGSPKRYAEAALNAASRGSRLTQHLLAFSRRQEIRPQTVNTNEILRETLLLCQQTVGEGVEMESRLRPDIWSCRMDPAQFEAAILNLAVNARDAMDRSGRLTITTENVTVADRSYAADLNPGDYIVVSVSDTGCGMSEDVLLRAFEPFYTTKEIGKGTGLGLSQVYGFAKQSGGTAQIESEVGSGTTVRIYIPRQEGPLPGEVTTAEDMSIPAPGNATILVVEDDPNVREMVVGILSNFGYQPLVARTGPEALAILQNEGMVDLLLSDVVMPAGMSGTDLARTARRLRPELKILLTSGYTGADPEPAEQREFPFIAKPYRARILGRKLREVLAEKSVGPTPIG